MSVLVVADEAEIDGLTARLVDAGRPAPGRFESRIWPGPSSAVPSATSSSPVLITPTRGRRQTHDLGPPQGVRARRSTAGVISIAGVQHLVAGRMSSPAGRTWLPTGDARPRARPPSPSVPGPLDHHHGVGAGGHGRAGHDPGRLARRRSCRRGSAPAAIVADHPEARALAGVGGAHGEAVHRRVRERRHRLGRDRPARRDETERVVDRHVDGFEPVDTREHVGTRARRVGSRDQQMPSRRQISARI